MQAKRVKMLKKFLHFFFFFYKLFLIFPIFFVFISCVQYLKVTSSLKLTLDSNLININNQWRL
jgi:hypothetical protein